MLNEGCCDISNEVIRLVHVALINLELPTLYTSLSQKLYLYLYIVCNLDHCFIVLLSVLSHVSGLRYEMR